MSNTDALDVVRKEETLRGMQLLVAAQRFYDGDMREDEFMEFVVRYGHAAMSRRIVMTETRNAQRGLEN